MFTMPAIHHSARVEDDSLGTLHLNALNGSSGFLGQTESTSNSQNGVFGGLFGASLSDNHPYRPQDSGMTFYESQSSKKSTPCCLSSSSHRKASSRDSKPNPKYVDAATSPNGPRRHSLDLDSMTVTKRHNYNRKLSLDELVIGPFSRFHRFRDDAIDEHEQTSEPDLTGLTMTEVVISPPGCHVSRHDDSKSKPVEDKKKKKRKSHTADVSVPERDLRKAERNKDSKKDQNSNVKHGSQYKGDPPQHDCQKDNITSASKVEPLRHNTQRDSVDPASQQRPDRGKDSLNKDRKLTAKAGEN